VRSQIEKPSSFFQGLPHLNCNRSVEVAAFHFGLKILWQKIAAQPGHRIIDPVVFGWGIDPKVLMGVNVHASLRFRQLLRSALN
jgi:hypothetical protein